MRSGRIYEINQYAADVLRQAVNVGYEEGVRAGQADRQDRFRGDYRNSYAYQDANYGYDGRYVSRTDYNYYFREGFRRGYEDGYNSRFNYGRSSNGTFGILANVLSTILNLQHLR
jgi:flagellar biosynthesis/type III secretory pathway protein FliH